MLSTLSSLPAQQSAKIPRVNELFVKTTFGKDVKEDLGLLIRQLKKGEATAEEKFSKIDGKLASAR